MLACLPEVITEMKTLKKALLSNHDVFHDISRWKRDKKYDVPFYVLFLLCLHCIQYVTINIVFQGKQAPNSPPFVIYFFKVSDEDLVQSLIFGDDLSLLVECNHTILMNFVSLCLQNTYSAKAQHRPSKYNHFNQVHESSMCLLSGWID